VGGVLGANMQRVDGYYLYTVGSQIHPLGELKGDISFGTGQPAIRATTISEARMPIIIAEGALDPLLSRSIFRLRTSVQSGKVLLDSIRAIKTSIMAATNEDAPLDWFEVFNLTTALTTFESVLQAELSLSPLYVVIPKAGYDTTTLIEDGAACFPAELPYKVAEAVSDLKQGTQCLAFGLFTAAGFHLHRANEAVLRRYWDVVSLGKARPVRGNMGDYLNEMKQRNFGDELVRAALKHLIDFHRNPLIHPEQNIESSDEAVALMNGIHNVIVQMLKVIPADLSSFGNEVGAISPPALSARIS
jgi:hypothetical protein